ncbi:MAG: hypothetical protein SGPRY_004418 [Prymnesium sp.]
MTVFSGMMTFMPPAWHAAQLPEKTDDPASTSPANAGAAARVRTPAARVEAAAAETDDSPSLEMGALKPATATTEAAKMVL